MTNDLKIVPFLPIDEIEEKAFDQLKETASMPFIHKHIAVMADCHYGKGSTIGSCIPTYGAIMPACVGVDIGCGMTAVRTSLEFKDIKDNLHQLRLAIEKAVPMGKSIHQTVPECENHNLKIGYLANIADERLEFYDSLNKPERNWRQQLGTLGGGNHFIELTVDEFDRVWIFLHSGSRGVGNAIARHHLKVAKDLMNKYFIQLPNPDLAYLVEGTPEFSEYIKDLLWAQEFAKENRLQMSYAVFSILKQEYDADIQQLIDCHHNFAKKENHFGKNVWVTRKGAIEAKEGQLGLIPGSMGTKSYVVQGLGNTGALNTAPHGAGRAMSRNKARAVFNMEDFNKQTAGVECKRDKEILDEIPGAYKDVDKVMKHSSKLVNVLLTFKQVLNTKGVGN